MEFGWSILAEPENPDEFRLVTYQNLEGATVADIMILVMWRAYNLAIAGPSRAFATLPATNSNMLQESATRVARNLVKSLRLRR
jgi:hypothetical protein